MVGYTVEYLLKFYFICCDVFRVILNLWGYEDTFVVFFDSDVFFVVFLLIDIDFNGGFFNLYIDAF